MTDLQKFARNVKFVYQTRGQTQKDIAEKAGITVVHLCRILSGQVPGVSFQVLADIADAIDVEFTDLLLDSGAFMLKYAEKYSQKPSPVAA